MTTKTTLIEIKHPQPWYWLVLIEEWGYVQSATSENQAMHIANELHKACDDAEIVLCEED